jgi:hypothetical protein
MASSIEWKHQSTREMSSSNAMGLSELPCPVCTVEMTFGSNAVQEPRFSLIDCNLSSFEAYHFQNLLVISISLAFSAWSPMVLSPCVQLWMRKHQIWGQMADEISALSILVYLK